MKDKFFGVPTFLAITLLALLMHPAVAASAPRTLSLASNCGSVYIVRAGDTLSAIAVRCGVTLWSLMSANGLRVTSIIYPGQRLAISGATGATTQRATSVTTTYTTCPNPYVVRSGDTLSLIAVRCGVTVYMIKQQNSLYSDLIRAGQVLYVRSAAAGAPSVVATPYPYYSGLTATATPMPYLPPATVDYLAPYPTPTPQIESPISLW